MCNNLYAAPLIFAHHALAGSDVANTILASRRIEFDMS